MELMDESLTRFLERSSILNNAVIAMPALLVLLFISVLPPLVLKAYPLLNKAFISVKLENSRVATAVSILPTSSSHCWVPSKEALRTTSVSSLASTSFIAG